MRTWITLISVLAILSAIVFTEQKIIADFKDEANKHIMQITEKIKNNSVDAQDVSEIRKLWNKRKNIIFMLANHNSFSALESSVAFMNYYYETKNIEQLRSQLIIFDNCVKMLKESSKLSVSNIL